MLDARIASSLNKIIQNFLLQEKGQSGGKERLRKRIGSFAEDIAYMIYDYFRVLAARDTVLDYADLFSITLRNDDVQEFDTSWDEILSFVTKIPPRWYSGKFVQTMNTWVWSTPNRIRIVRHGNSSEDIEAWLSDIESDGEKKNRSETSITKFWRQKLENWDRSSGFESQGIKWYWKETRSLLSVERQKDSVREETNAVSGTTMMGVQNQHQKPVHSLWATNTKR